MLRENAVVVDYQNGVATVKCHSKSACGQCAAKSSCGTAALAELNGEHSEHIFTVATITPVSIGQTVEVGLEERPLFVFHTTGLCDSAGDPFVCYTYRCISFSTRVDERDVYLFFQPHFLLLSCVFWCKNCNVNQLISQFCYAYCNFVLALANTSTTFHRVL